MSFLFRSLTATFCFSWYAHIVAVLRRKTYLIQPVIQLSKFNRAPQGVAGGVRGTYPKKKIVFRLLPLNNKVGNFSVPSLLIADFFEEMDKLFFFFAWKRRVIRVLPLHLFRMGSAYVQPLWRKKFFIQKQKTAENPLFMGIFGWKNILKFFWNP